MLLKIDIYKIKFSKNLPKEKSKNNQQENPEKVLVKRKNNKVIKKCLKNKI